jgi:hypothetical protein
MTALQVKNYVRATLLAQRTIAQEILVFDELVDFITSSITTGIPAWNAALTFNNDGTGTGAFATYPDTNGALRFWKSKTDGNINHTPPTNPAITEDTYWIEVSPSAGSAIKEWAAGIYGSGLVIVYFSNELYKLENATRPFESVNINTEITGGDWIKIGQTNAGIFETDADTTVDPIVLDCDSFSDILFNGTDAIAASAAIQLANDTNARRMKFCFTITGAPVLELPADCKMPGFQSGWTDADKELDFGAIGAGDFALEFTWYETGGYYQTTLTGGF